MTGIRTLPGGKLLAAAAFAVLLIAGTAGCAGRAARALPKAAPGHHLDVSYAHAYSSLAQLRNSASSVAVLRATGSSTVITIGATGHGIPWTLSTVNVVRQLSGPALPPSFELRQLGKAGVPVSTGDIPVADSLVSKGGVYIAYLQPFTMGNGPVAGQYVTVGGLQGLFRDSQPGSNPIAPGNMSAKTFNRVDPNNPSLPAQISVTQAEQNGSSQ